MGARLAAAEARGAAEAGEAARLRAGLEAAGARLALCRRGARPGRAGTFFCAAASYARPRPLAGPPGDIRPRRRRCTEPAAAAAPAPASAGGGREDVLWRELAAEEQRRTRGAARDEAPARGRRPGPRASAEQVGGRGRAAWRDPGQLCDRGPVVGLRRAAGSAAAGTAVTRAAPRAAHGAAGGGARRAGRAAARVAQPARVAPRQPARARRRGWRGARRLRRALGRRARRAAAPGASGAPCSSGHEPVNGHACASSPHAASHAPIHAAEQARGAACVPRLR